MYIIYVSVRSASLRPSVDPFGIPARSSSEWVRKLDLHHFGRVFHALLDSPNELRHGFCCPAVLIYQASQRSPQIFDGSVLLKICRAVHFRHEIDPFLCRKLESFLTVMAARLVRPEDVIIVSMLLSNEWHQNTIATLQLSGDLSERKVDSVVRALPKPSDPRSRHDLCLPTASLLPFSSATTQHIVNSPPGNALFRKVVYCFSF